MTTRDIAFDFQIKLLMIGDSGKKRGEMTLCSPWLFRKVIGHFSTVTWQSDLYHGRRLH